MKNSETIKTKSEILFLYEASYNIPNGDPFTGEQRFDEETKKILVSDVRIKRFIRDYLNDNDEEIYVINDKSFAEGNESVTSASRIKSLVDKNISDSAKKKRTKDFSPAKFVMKKCVDVRLFGGISTVKGDAVNLTGPVQFALLNPSMNQVNLRMHQNTSHFSSSAEKSQGAIGTTSLVPYALIQIHGWLNPNVAEHTGMQAEDLKKMFAGMWYGTSGEGSSHSRTKIGQNGILILEIVYGETKKKVYGLDRLIQLIPQEGKREEEIRSMDDYTLNFDNLFEVVKDEKISHVNYYSEIGEIRKQFEGKDKFKALEL